MAMTPASAGAASGPVDARQRRAVFRALHERGCFVIPNPWDAGSARYLASLGFKALATTSAGFAFSRGLPDSEAMSRDLALRHIAEMVEATGLPVNADFQAGFSDTPEGVADSVRRCIDTGVAGLSIEDSTGDPARPLFDLPVALERLKAARAAVDASGSGALLTARAECFLTGHPDSLREALRRLEAYGAAGADVLYAPGPKTRSEIAAIVKAVSPKPVNVLVSSAVGLTVAEVAELGARRISVGSALARAAWTGFMKAAELIVREGSFKGFDGTVTHAELNRFFGA